MDKNFMTVEQLIEKLSKIKDKSKQVVMEADWEVEVPVLGIYESEDAVGISTYTYEEGGRPVTLIFPNHLGAKVRECIEDEKFVEACQYCRKIIWKDTVLKQAPYFDETQTIWDFEPSIRFGFYLDGWKVSEDAKI